MIGSEGVVARSLISAAAVFPDNGQTTPPRQWSRREVAVMPVLPDFKVAGDEGSYFSGTNAAFGTGAAAANQAGFLVTSALFTVLNKAKVGGPRSYLDYVRMLCTAAGTGTTSMQIGIVLDTIIRGSAGTAVPLSSANQDAGGAPISQVLYNPTVAGAGSAAAQICRACAKGAALAVNDEILLIFGSVEKSSAGAFASTAARYVVPCPPVIVGPGVNQSVVIHGWFPGVSAAPSFEFEVGLLER